MTTIDMRLGADRGRAAETPFELTWQGWKDIFWRVKAEFVADRLTLIAAGATFYLLLALFPALAAFVSLYGFVADPVTIGDHIAFLGGVLPSGGIDLIRAQLESLAAQNEAALSFGFIFGLLFALWSANNGIKTLFEALNVAYEEEEKRSFVRLNLVSLAFTLGAIVIGILFIVGVGVVPAMLAFMGLGGFQETLISLLRWPVLIVISALGISLLYRFGPSRERAQWSWVSWGSVIASVLWLVASILFSWYLANFADYNATYGSLGAVIGFMMWTWLSVVILLAGAELNAEMEHQTAVDTTTGAPRPMGLRGATMADTLGASREHASAAAEPAFEPARRREQISGAQAVGRRRYSSLGTVLGFALPVAVLIGALAMDLVEGKRPRRRRIDRPAAGQKDRQATRAIGATFAPWIRQARELIESPAGRAMLERALRSTLRAGRSFRS
ncbi:MAG: YihY/virulence factor BrkB family protein [Propylenella sp.]